MILCDEDIQKAIQAGEIVITPCSDTFEPASYDMRVGDLAITKTEVVKVRETGHVAIPRGETAVIYPVECIKLGLTLAARFGLVSKFARAGLVLLSGPQVDPGFEGILEITVFNAGNRAVHLSAEEAFATIEFERLSSPASHGYRGPYQGRKPASSEILDLIQSRRKSFAEYEEEFEDLRREIDSVKAQSEHLSRVHGWVIRGMVLGTCVAVVVALLTLLFNAVWGTASP